MSFHTSSGASPGCSSYEHPGKYHVRFHGLLRAREARKAYIALSSRKPPGELHVRIENVSGQVIVHGGSSNTAVINASEAKDLASVLWELREALPKINVPVDRQKALSNELGKAEGELSLNMPKRHLIRASLGSIKNILEGAAGSVVATAFVDRLSKFVN